MWKIIKKNFESTDSLVSLALGLAVVLVIGMTIVNYIKSKSQVATSTTQQEQKSPTGETLPAKHTVTEGETLWSISESYHKSGYNWVDVQKANKLTSPETIEAGQELTMPVVTPIVEPAGDVSSTAAPTISAKAYTVVTGDDLWNIAVKAYGDGYRWVDIANTNHLTNPSLIHAGNVLQLP